MMNLMKRFRLRKRRQQQRSSSTSVDARDVTLRAIPDDDGFRAVRKTKFTLKECDSSCCTASLSEQGEGEGEEDMICMICHEDDTENDDSHTMLPCGHSCHSKCITQWIERRNNSCPMCRSEIATEVVIEKEEEEDFLFLSEEEEEENLEFMASMLGSSNSTSNNNNTIQAENVDDLLASCIFQRHMTQELR